MTDEEIKPAPGRSYRYFAKCECGYYLVIKDSQSMKCDRCNKNYWTKCHGIIVGSHGVVTEALNVGYTIGKKKYIKTMLFMWEL